MNNSNQTGSTVASLRLTSTIPKLEKELKKLGFDRKHHNGFEHTQSKVIIDFLKNKIDEFDKKFKEDAEKPENKGKPYQNPTAIYPRGNDADKEYIGKLLENALKKQKKTFAVVNASALDIAMTSSSKAITKVFSPAPLAQPQQKQYTPAKIISFLERFAYKAQTLLSTIGSGISNIPTKISQGITSFATETIKNPIRLFIKREEVKSNPFNFIDENGNPHPDQSNTPPPSAMQKIEDRIRDEDKKANSDSANFRSELDVQSTSRTILPPSYGEVFQQEAKKSNAFHLQKLQELTLKRGYNHHEVSFDKNPNSPSQLSQSQLSQALNGVDPSEYPDLYKQLSQMAAQESSGIPSEPKATLPQNFLMALATQGNPPSRTSSPDLSSAQNPAGANLSLLARSRQQNQSINPPTPQESNSALSRTSTNPEARQINLDPLVTKMNTFISKEQRFGEQSSSGGRSGENPPRTPPDSDSLFGSIISSSGNPKPLTTARQSTLQKATPEEIALFNSLKRSGPSGEIGVNSSARGVTEVYYGKGGFMNRLAEAEAKDPPPSSSPATARTDHLTHIKRQGGTLSTFVYR